MGYFSRKTGRKIKNAYGAGRSRTGSAGVGSKRGEKGRKGRGMTEAHRRAATSRRRKVKNIKRGK